jgi:hypothetical protein
MVRRGTGGREKQEEGEKMGGGKGGDIDCAGICRWLELNPPP